MIYKRRHKLHNSKKISLVLLLFSFTFIFSHAIFSQDSESEDQLQKKKEEIEEIQTELERVRGEKQTLSSTIQYLDGKIKLAEAKITQTERQLRLLEAQIADITAKMSQLDVSLVQITDVLIERISSTYKRSRINPLAILITKNDLNQLLSQYKYLQNSQKHDRKILLQLETAKTDLSNQKLIKQQKQDELDELSQQLEAQQLTLATQQLEKQKLLEITKNDEKKFQSELASKMAELEAIQSIIAGKGDETESGLVEEGQIIAQVIPGPSVCSTGGHLHFEVSVDEYHQDPAKYLKPIEVVWDNDPDGSFSFSGSWNWPINDPVRITQGYGMTFYAGTLRYYGGAPHTGIDMINRSDLSVKAVKSGTLYRGAIPCRGGSLRYVKVAHEDNHISTYYLHVNY